MTQSTQFAGKSRITGFTFPGAGAASSAFANTILETWGQTKYSHRLHERFHAHACFVRAEAGIADRE